MGSIGRLTITRRARALVIAAATVAASATPVLAQPSPQQKIAMQAKPSVVRVWGAYVATYSIAGENVTQAIGGTGTGFFITPDGYIATNAHVVSDIHEGEEAAKKTLYEKLLKELDKAYAAEIARMSDEDIKRLLKAIKLVKLEKRAYVVLPNGDKLDYEIKEYGKPGSGRDAAIIKVKTENAPTLPIGDSSKAEIADQIVVIGYPGVADMKVLLDEKSQLQASITDGAISSLKKANTGEPILQISAPITHGNSGGPALDLSGNVIGLATFGNESEIQGFNFLVASATLKDLIEDGKIEPKQSETNKLWKEGLDLYWAHRYTPAITKFQEVEAAFPQHSEAPALIRQSTTARKEGKEKKPESSNTGVIAGGVIGGIVVLGGLVFVLRRKKKPAPAQPPHPGMHGMHHPPQPAYPMPPMQQPPMQQPHQPPMQPPPPMQQPPMQQPHPPPMQPPPAMPPPPAHSPFAPPAMPVPQGGSFGQPPQMYGRAHPPSQPQPVGFAPPQQMGFTPPQQMGAHQGGHAPVAKTMAIQPGPAAPQVAPTAFGSLSIGSVTAMRGQLSGQRFAVTATGIIIGRQPGVAHVLVNDHRASGKHVWIGMDQGRLVAIDQGTTNGTYINDVNRGRITRHELRDGDMIIVGDPDCLTLQVKIG